MQALVLLSWSWLLPQVLPVFQSLPTRYSTHHTMGCLCSPGRTARMPSQVESRPAVCHQCTCVVAGFGKLLYGMAQV
jgi:hypothetical protein